MIIKHHKCNSTDSKTFFSGAYLKSMHQWRSAVCQAGRKSRWFGTAAVGSAAACTAEVGTVAVGTPEVGSAEIGTAGVGTAAAAETLGISLWTASSPPELSPSRRPRSGRLWRLAPQGCRSVLHF